MIHGLFMAAQGARIEALRQDVIANNVANAGTSSFKRDLVLLESLGNLGDRPEQGPSPPHLRDMPAGVAVAGVYTDFSQGPVEDTGSVMDLAVVGEAFLRVSDGKQQYLSRDGKLAIDSRGRIVLRDSGHAVLNSNGGPLIVSDPELPLEIAVDGTITQAGGQQTVGQLALVKPASYAAMEKVGNSLYRTQSNLAPAAADATVRQRMLERSATNPVLETTELIQAARAFEANINMIRYQDDSLARLLSSVSRR